VDWIYGASTYELLQLARQNLDFKPFSERDRFEEHLAFLSTDLDRLTTELSLVCRNCEVGITDQSKQLTSMNLEDFVCSDFDSTDGTNVYPSRDCPAADLAYAMAPSPKRAPCCLNQSLVTASMAVMTWLTFAPECNAGLRTRIRASKMPAPPDSAPQSTPE
jgi:hypothetical protein